jgi:PAS domain S-box-containing protein
VFLDGLARAVPTAVRRLAALVLAAAGLATGAAAAGPAADPRTLRIAVAPYAPFAVPAADGGYAGFDVETLRLVCAANGWTPEFVPVPFGEVLDAVASGRADTAAAALYVTPERSARLPFSRSYLETGLVYVVRADGPSPTAARRIGVKSGATGETVARNLVGGRPGFEVVPFAETIGSFEALRDGEVDAVLNDYFNSIALISERFEGELAIPRRWGGPWLIVRARLAFPLNPARPELVPAFDATLGELARGGTLERIEVKWLHATMPPDWAQLALYAAAALAALAVAGGAASRVFLARGRTRLLEAYWHQLEALPEAVLVEAGGTIAYSNRAARRFLSGADDRPLEGLALDALGLPAAPPAGSCELEVRGLDGRRHEVEAEATRVEFRDAAAWQWVLRDVSELRRAQRQLAGAFERQAALLRFQEQMIETSAAFIAVVDEDGRVILWNRAAERLTGFARGEVTGDGRLWDRLLRDASGAFREALRAATISAPPAEGIPFPIHGRDGRELTIGFFFSPLGEVERDSRIVVFGVDMTAERELAEQLQQSQKLEAMGRLATGVAHEFNNILQVILGYAEMLAGGAAVRPAEAFEHLRKASMHGAALARQLLLFGRQQPLQRAPLDVDELIADTRRLLQPLLGERIRLELRLGSAGAVLADRVQLQQVLINLATNARDAMPEGGRFSIATETTSLDEEQARRLVGLAPGAWVVIRAEDTGNGIPAAILDRIFEPFFTTKGSGRGTGLGLATAHGIVAQHGGTIEVESLPGRGTRFSLYLPPSFQAAAPPAEPPAFRAGGDDTTVLLVEDDEGVREALAAGLALLGYRVQVADGVAAARDLPMPPGSVVLVTDVRLGDGSGLEVAAAMRARRAGLPVCFLTGHGAAAELEEAARDPRTVVLSKPCSLAELGATLRRLASLESAPSELALR